MPVLSKDPRTIHPAYKEAVADSLLNGLAARLAGRGEFYDIIYGAKPSVVLMSEFLVPMPLTERAGDEEADPINISAHGLDFQIRSAAKRATLEVALTGAVYVRILPTEDEVKPGGRLQATFPLTKEARAEIRGKINAALDELKATLPKGSDNREWAEKSLLVRRGVYESMGLRFDNRLDREPEGEKEQVEPVEDEETEEGDQRAARAVPVTPDTPDRLVKSISPPAKWLRLELKLPSFDFTPETAAQDARQATDVLNHAIAQQLTDWVASKDPTRGGALWGYRRVHMKPSDVRDWARYLKELRASGLPVIVPKIDLRWIIEAHPDPVDPARMSLHVALENWSVPPKSGSVKELEQAFFQVSVAVSAPAADHLPLHLDRVKPSYRYNRYLKYPALGFNGGVVLTSDESRHRLTTTWTPRYVLPRIIPTEGEIELNIEKLSQPDCLTGLRPLIKAYEAWLTKVEQHPVDQGIDGPNASEKITAERDKLHRDLIEWRRELAAIRSGLKILEESRAHWSGPGVQKSPLGIPFEAWVSMNTAMAKIARAKHYDTWRLFQLAFILASIPAFATRIPEFHGFYEGEVVETSNAVTLLYFSTGGGKSEAFLGLLAFVLFLDRLRGKHRGVSALMRYPLRLLTLQQARRTFATLGAAEEVRFTRGHPGEPFSLGFWVGSSNTPNWHSDDGYEEVPHDSEIAPTAEVGYLETQPYKSARERWLKLTACPFCGSPDGSPLALRRHAGNGGDTLGHYCTAPKNKCSWNRRFDAPTPLPFYIVDEDIYDLAPAVLLGTVDKLAVIGQSPGTIRKFFGMFGFAPLIETENQRLLVPLTRKQWDGEPGATTRALSPSFRTGEGLFFDPFPSLLIQDEAHLLDESLGTFSSLFESALEAAWDELSPLLKGRISCEPNSSVRRKIKVIAASATVSEPWRQMMNLYQRKTVQFPYPGPSLYESFYASPLQPDDTSEDTERTIIPLRDVELRSHWARVYAAVLTNGHRHTVAMASVLAHYHLMVTGLYERLRSEDTSVQDAARAELIRWVSAGPLQSQFARLLTQADAASLLTLVDLHRIALTYVTNKKGGDQVIDQESSQFAKLHQENGHPRQALSSELISGAVSAAEIQDVVRRAEARVRPGDPFPELTDTLRSVIATSAISHGVDVEEFNAMFFAGIPSDIAEYIQASSRVGRTHVGFSLLVPVPQRHRDRFVLEIHDIFHRFLERMILPAAVDRWAEKALVRVMPSFFQEYLCGVRAIQDLCHAPDLHKVASSTYAWATDARDFLNLPANHVDTESFMENALGLTFSPSPEGKSYYSAMVKKELSNYRESFGIDRLVNSTRLERFFAVRNRLLRPMTSLRDVDLPGTICESFIDASSRPVNEGSTNRVMQFIRKGSGADIDTTDKDTEAQS
jgi:hypothetical protein